MSELERKRERRDSHGRGQARVQSRNDLPKRGDVKFRSSRP